MKKFIILLLFPFFALSQSNKKYIRVNFVSVCCGAPSEEIILDFVKKYQLRHNLKPFEVCYFSNGIEGEIALFIGTDNLNRKNQKRFREILESLADDQTREGKQYQMGRVEVAEDFVPNAYLKEIHSRLGNQFYFLKM